MQQCLQNSAVELSSYTPSSLLEQYSANKQIMRFLRYYVYPREVSGQRADIHHVIDHGYAHLYPGLAKGKKCISVHDLIPMLNWQGALHSELGSTGILAKSRRPRLNIHSLSFVHKYDQIITISENTADDLVKHLDLDRGKIAVISPAIDESFKPLTIEQVDGFSKRHELDTNCKWIMISGAEFYKNHVTSLKILQQLNLTQDIPIKLIKSGLPSAEFNSLVKSMGLEDLVKTIYFKDPAELPLLYNFVDCLLFPSLYEGFGMPVAEALACGTPVVTSNRGALPEVGGKLAIQLNPFDIDGMCKAVQQVLHEQQIKAKFSHEGPLWVSKFRPKAIATKLEKLYENILSHDH